MLCLRDKTVLVGVSGGIAAYKTCTLVSKLVQCGAAVHVMMTENATRFVAPLSFETLSHNRVVVDTFDRNFTWEVEHVALSKKADAVIIAPATANVLAKFACGICDDFLTTTVLACRCPVLFAPAMNTAMLDNPATKQNIKTLVERGFIPVYGNSGYLACGDSGRGRMAEPDELLEALSGVLCAKKDYDGKTVLVTAGATRADIDPVRYITNRSSGKMGYCIARDAYLRGAKIIFVHGSISNELTIPSDWQNIEVSSTREMLEKVKNIYTECDYYICAAAPCDYELTPARQKIKDSELSLSLKKAPDIAKWLGKNKKSKLVIFAAETNDGIVNAKNKLTAKNADMVVYNDVTQAGAGFDCDTNIVTLIWSDGEREYPLLKKSEVAHIILDTLLSI